MRQSTYLQYDKIGRYTQKIITIFSCRALLCTAGSLFCLNSRQNRVVYFHINSLNIRCFLSMSHRWESDINATECFSMWVVQKEVKRRQDSTKQHMNGLLQVSKRTSLLRNDYFHLPIALLSGYAHCLLYDKRGTMRHALSTLVP